MHVMVYAVVLAVLWSGGLLLIGTMIELFCPREVRPKPDVSVIGVRQMLREEGTHLMSVRQQTAYAGWEVAEKTWQAAEAATRGPRPPPPEVTPFNMPRAALCLSGGGIRSAAFCLGVIQAFAARRMLSQFDYLSTVSGGGYIGGWLTRCIHAWRGDVAGVENHLNIYKKIIFKPPLREADGGRLDRDAPIEPRELDTLRRYTNFLTPSPGFASADTWAGIVLWLRNTLINWAVFMPLALAGAGFPIVYFALTCMLGTGWAGGPLWRTLIVALWAGGLICLFVSNFNICINVPTHDFERTFVPDNVEYVGPRGKTVWWRICVWSLLWTFFAPLAVAPALSPPQSSDSARAAFYPATPAATPVPAKPHSPIIIIVNSRPAVLCQQRIAMSTIHGCAQAAPPGAVGQMLLLPGGCTPVPPGPDFAACRPSDPTIFSTEIFGGPRLILLPLLNLVTCILAYLMAWIYCVLDKPIAADRQAARVAATKATPMEKMHALKDIARAVAADRKAFPRNLPAWLVSGLISSTLMLVGLCLAYRRDALYLALAGPVWVAVAELIRSSAYVAVRRDGLFSDLDREWLARLSGVKLRTTLAAGAIGTAILYFPQWLLNNSQHDYGIITAIIGFLSGPVAAFIGKSPLTQFLHGTKSGKRAFWQRPQFLVAALATVFAAAMMMLGGAFLVWLAMHACPLAATLWRLCGWVTFPCSSVQDFAQFGLAVAVIAVLFAGLALLIDRGVNLNRFSMHAVYRDRLIRAFLGTASSAHYDWKNVDPKDPTPTRVPDGFTDFDPADNMRMADALDRVADPSVKALFHVINVALNRTSGGNTARAERKAAPFTITPLRCGSAVLDGWRGAYVSTKDYAGGEKETGASDCQNGITLGTAMAISGAAVSPNMGYNSSPFAAFLMTLFNVRLGAWLANPDGKDKSSKRFDKSGPKFAIPTMLEELLGQSNVKGSYVYLSDGGHFDNLGLYEMLRRRCAQIVVVDAGADPKYAYFDLGHTLEMAFIDLGVQVRFEPGISTKIKTLSPFAAIAEITYPPDAEAELPRSKGKLIYIKPWLPTTAPIELLAYKRVKPNFPHEPTEDQFFTESDFESYRRLGEYLTNDMLTRTVTKHRLDNLFDRATVLARGRARAARANPEPTSSPLAG